MTRLKRSFWCILACALVLCSLFVAVNAASGVARADDCAHETFVDGVCSNCGYPCMHSQYDSDSGTCSICNVTLVAVIETYLIPHGYRSFADAVNYMSDGSSATIKLLNDGEFCGFSNKIVTLDLNGKTLTAKEDVTVSGKGQLIVTDSVGTGVLKLDAQLHFEWDGSLTVKSGTISGSKDQTMIYSYDYSKVCVEGGAIDTRTWFYGKSYGLTVTGGKIHSVWYNITTPPDISGGEIQDILFYNHPSGVFSGGTMAKIRFYFTLTPDYARLLKEGYAYKSVTSGEVVKPNAMSSEIAVSIVECSDHTSFTDGACDYCGSLCSHADVNVSTGTCNKCGTAFAACITEISGAVKGANSFQNAITDAPNNATITMFDDSVFYGCSNKTFTLELNGKALTTTEDVEISNSNVTIKDTVGEGRIGTTKKITFSGCEATIDGVHFTTENADGNIYVDYTIMSVNKSRFDLPVTGTDSRGMTISVSYFKFLHAYSGDFNIESGEIENIYTSSDIASIFAGGTIGSVEKYDGYSYYKLLKDGYAYKNYETGEYINKYEMTKGVKVKVVECEHTGYTNGECNYCSYVCPHDNINNSTGKCDKCDVVMAACVGDTPYLTFKAAVDSLGTDHAEIRLNKDDELCSIENKDVTLLLNGYSLHTNGNAEIEIKNSTITIVGTNSSDAIKLAGKLTLVGTTLQSSSGSGSLSIDDSSSANSELILGENSAIKIDQSSTFAILCPVYVKNDTVSITMTSGRITDLYAETNLTLDVSSDAVIDVLHIVNASRILQRGAKFGSIAFESGTEQDYLSLLTDGNAYRNSETSEFVKYSEMTEGVKVEITACNHLSIDENFNCEYCGKSIYVEVKHGTDNVYYDDFGVASASLDNGDVMTVLQDIKLTWSFTISKQITLNLNGKKLTHFGLSFEATLTVIDEIGGGYVSFTPSQAGTEVSVYGKDETELSVTLTTGNLRIYGGKVVRLTVYNNRKTSEILPQGYFFIKPDEDNRNLTYQEAQNASAPLIVRKCDHSQFNDDFVCDYCNETLEDKTLIKKVMSDLDNAKNELNAAISTKADATVINGKIDELEKAIESAKTTSETADSTLKDELLKKIAEAKEEAISAANAALSEARTALEESIGKKANSEDVNKQIDDLTEAINNAITLTETFATDKDDALKAELIEKIAKAKEEAISAANTALSEAKTALEKSIDTKANAEDVNKKIDDLTEAITLAETISKEYGDLQNEELKGELETTVSEAKTELQNAIDALSKRVDDLEKEVDKTSITVNNLLIAFIVIAVILTLAIVALTVTLIVTKRRN